MTLIKNSENTGCCDTEQNQQQCRDEYQKHIVVVHANTVVDPGTVMVEPRNTFIANGAVL
jgi:hypothetical protein